MALFSIFISKLDFVEGGFQIHQDDKGNYNSLGQLVGTNHGISAKFYESVIGRPPTKADMLNLTKAEAHSLYKVYFWDKVKADEINSQAIANTVVDHHVNSGRGVQLAQKVLNNTFNFNLAVDNASGPNTINALNSVKETDFVPAYNQARANYYHSISNNQSFIDGWLNRLEEFALTNTGKGLSVVTGLALLFGLYLIFKKRK